MTSSLFFGSVQEKIRKEKMRRCDGCGFPNKVSTRNREKSCFLCGLTQLPPPRGLSRSAGGKTTPNLPSPAASEGYTLLYGFVPLANPQATMQRSSSAKSTHLIPLKSAGASRQRQRQATSASSQPVPLNRLRELPPLNRLRPCILFPHLLSDQLFRDGGRNVSSVPIRSPKHEVFQAPEVTVLQFVGK